MSKSATRLKIGPAAEQYKEFHGVPPTNVTVTRLWLPGGLVLIGTGLDIGYRTKNKKSSKCNVNYVHDFGPRVRIYRRAEANERATLTYRSFPRTLWVLGSNIGFTYRDQDGEEVEIKGSTKYRLCATPCRKRLVVVGPQGVELLCKGGDLRVADWLYN